MKSMLALGLLVALGVAGLGFADTATTQPASPVNKYCAVEGAPHEIDPSVTTMYNGKTYGFCCKDCVVEFKKDPEKYAAKAK